MRPILLGIAISAVLATGLLTSFSISETAFGAQGGGGSFPPEFGRGGNGGGDGIGHNGNNGGGGGGGGSIGGLEPCGGGSGSGVGGGGSGGGCKP